MEVVEDDHSVDDESESQYDVYLPASPPVTTTPGRLERFLSRLLRRRGSLRKVLRSERR